MISVRSLPQSVNFCMREVACAHGLQGPTHDCWQTTLLFSSQSTQPSHLSYSPKVEGIRRSNDRYFSDFVQQPQELPADRKTNYSHGYSGSILNHHSGD